MTWIKMSFLITLLFIQLVKHNPDNHQMIFKAIYLGIYKAAIEAMVFLINKKNKTNNLAKKATLKAITLLCIELMLLL